MKATIRELNQPATFRISDRKEKYFRYQYTAVCYDGIRMYDAVTLRIYQTDARSYCCMWVPGNTSSRNGSGNAGGYGYHRASAAAAEAIHNAGFDLSEPINGRGDGAIEDAVKAIAHAVWGESIQVHVVKSNP